MIYVIFLGILITFGLQVLISMKGLGLGAALNRAFHFIFHTRASDFLGNRAARNVMAKTWTQVLTLDDREWASPLSTVTHCTV